MFLSWYTADSHQNIAIRGWDRCEGADCGERCGGANGGSDLARQHIAGGHHSIPIWSNLIQFEHVWESHDDMKFLLVARYLSVCLSVYLSDLIGSHLIWPDPPTWLSISLSFNQSISQSDSQSVCLSVCLSVSQSVCLSVSLSIYPFIYLSLSVSMSISLSLSICVYIFIWI